ncbi:anthrone oxygenase family protein [Devosia sediminis]|uniref:DUF1772 domain-containing protein n=1 Tax=Devosia sediminis TaxID=2798801 RepID=A0A934IVV3_9HYPH|nr:anthrone oxygenase family protein [Devosia sediminis]MBJ3785302.1 DUF1772 domain-containing protein [Devosia sediminis]
MALFQLVLLGLGALGCAVISGVYFAFSTFIMTALAQRGLAGAEAMRSIDEVILRSAFMPLFFGTTLASLAIGVASLFQLGTPAGWAMLAGAVVYLLGMFGCTVLFNVPLNNRLADTPLATIWPVYLREWTGWNHVRTVASVLAASLFLYALTACKPCCS